MSRWMVLAAVAVLSFTMAQAARAEEAKPVPYPLKTCLISDEELGSMGDPIVHVHEGQEIKFCCGGCVKEFKKEPAKYMAKLKEETEKAKKTEKAE